MKRCTVCIISCTLIYSLKNVPHLFLLLYLAVVCSSGYYNKINFQCFWHCFQQSDFASGYNMRPSITSTVIATLCSFETVMHSCSSMRSDLVFQQLYRKTLTVIFSACFGWMPNSFNYISFSREDPGILTSSRCDLSRVVKKKKRPSPQ